MSEKFEQEPTIKEIVERIRTGGSADLQILCDALAKAEARIAELEGRVAQRDKALENLTYKAEGKYYIAVTEPTAVTNIIRQALATKPQEAEPQLIGIDTAEPGADQTAVWPPEAEVECPEGCREGEIKSTGSGGIIYRAPCPIHGQTEEKP